MKKPIPPPAHLSREARKLWRDLTETYVFDDPGAIAILGSALESFDRCHEARKILSTEGLSVKDRFGVPRVHPLCAVARDAEAAFRSAMRQLGIGADSQPTRSPGRPTASRLM